MLFHYGWNNSIEFVEYGTEDFIYNAGLQLEYTLKNQYLFSLNSFLFFNKYRIYSLSKTFVLSQLNFSIGYKF